MTATDHQSRPFVPEARAALVRYQVKNLERAIGFYTQHLGFQLVQKAGPVAIVKRGDLHLLLSGPESSGSRAMPDGRRQEPGGWNRIVLYVENLDSTIPALRKGGSRFRNEVEAGPGGKQIQIEDPDGNPIELHEAPRGRAASSRPPLLAERGSRQVGSDLDDGLCFPGGRGERPGRIQGLVMQVDPLTGLEVARRGLYVHFPYCLRRCPYCDFTIAIARTVPEARYADAVLAELRLRVARRPAWKERPLDSIYFGGGTPSLWDPGEVKRVLEGIAAALPLAADAEISLVK